MDLNPLVGQGSEVVGTLADMALGVQEDGGCEAAVLRVWGDGGDEGLVTC